MDANDVQKLMVNLPYLLDGLAQDELAAFNAGKAPAQRVVDPMSDVIVDECWYGRVALLFTNYVRTDSGSLE